MIALERDVDYAANDFIYGDIRCRLLNADDNGATFTWNHGTVWMSYEWLAEHPPHKLSPIKHPGSHQVRCRIVGTYKGRPWEYVDPEGSDGSQFIYDDVDPSRWWWTGGNFGCDCNRSSFLPDSMEANDDCGKDIMIDRIEPLDPKYPTLHLNETANGKDY